MTRTVHGVYTPGDKRLLHNVTNLPRVPDNVILVRFVEHDHSFMRVGFFCFTFIQNMLDNPALSAEYDLSFACNLLQFIMLCTPKGIAR